MRVLAIVITLACIAIPARGAARPKLKIAVAPLAGDPGGTIAEAVADALAGKDYAVVGPREVGREKIKLGLPDELDARSARKLARKLGVAAVIDGKVGRSGGKRVLHLEVHRRGTPGSGFTVEFRSASSNGFRRGVRDEIGKKLDGAGDDPEDEADEARKPPPFSDAGRSRPPGDGPGEPATRRADDDAGKRSTGDDARARGDAGEAERRPRLADDGETARRRSADDATRRPRRPAETGKRPRRVAAADDDDTAVHARKRRTRDGGSPTTAVRVGAGGSLAQRELSWELRGGFTQVPPRVLTTAGGGRVDGEIYPLALADPGSNLAGLGLAAAYDRTFGLAIKIPNQTVRAPIDQSHYAIGARYRLALGEASSVTFGLDYARRRYVAERGGLMGAVLDAPDVDYAAVSPGVALRVPVAAPVAVFGGADALLIFEAGGIQSSASYGPATVYGLEGTAGVDIALARQIGLRIAVEYSQIKFSFTPKGATMANNRDNDPATQDVMGATDRSIGGAVTLGLVY